MITLIVVSFLIGFFSRSADMIADEIKKPRILAGPVIGAIYGSLLAFGISYFGDVSSMIIAVLVGVIITRKIDHRVHYVGMVVLIIMLSLFGIPEINLPILAVFLFAGIADEMGSDLSDEKKIKGKISKFFSARLTMDVTAFAISAFTGNWAFLAAMIAADLGYTHMFMCSKVSSSIEKIFTSK